MRLNKLQPHSSINLPIQQARAFMLGKCGLKKLEI